MFLCFNRPLCFMGVQRASSRLCIARERFCCGAATFRYSYLCEIIMLWDDLSVRKFDRRYDFVDRPSMPVEAYA
jgi:hypothetical protein